MSTATAERPKTRPLPAEAATDPTPVDPASYVPPLAHIGEIVLWYPDGDTARAPRYGLVREVNDRTVALDLPQTGTTEFRSDVRHVTDPKFRRGNEDDQQMGRWDFTWQGKLLRRLKSELGIDNADL